MKQAPKTIHLKDYKPSDYLIETVKLDVELHPTETRVTSKIRFRPNPAVKSRSRSLRLDGEHLKLLSVSLAGQVLDKKDYKQTKQSLTLLNVPEKAFTVEIVTTCNPQGNKSLSGLYRSGAIYCTQCEAQGFRRITYYLDRPDILAVFTTRIEADLTEAPVLLSNGNLIKSGPARKKGRHFVIWHDPYPKPSYLFALVGGQLAEVSDTFKTRSGRTVDLKIFVEPGKEDRCAWAMDSLKRSMRWDEKRFGLEYDLDIFMIVAVSDFNMGAMENKGLNIFNDKLILARPDTATDNDYAAIEAVIAHEYFHNWTGNRITCRDWFQLCLKEGLTVFRDQEFTSDERSRTVKRIQDVRLLRAHQFPEDAGPLAHPVRPSSYIEINNFYTATVYEKGAELCRMIFLMLGKEGFRKGMDVYFERHDGEAATVEDFIKSFEDANKADLSQFMRWYEQAGTPQLVCKLSHNKKAQTVQLTFHQLPPRVPTAGVHGDTAKRPYHIPVKVGLLDKDGNDLPLELITGETISDGLLHLKEHTQSFHFKDMAARPIPSILREFSAPVHLSLELSDKDLEFLMAHDKDLFNRWQAAQTYTTQILVDLVGLLSQGKKTNRSGHIATLLENTLNNEDLEPAYRAEFLRLPGEGDIARAIGDNVDPEVIHKARKSLLRGVATKLMPVLIDLYDTFTVKGKYSPLAASAGKRSLKNGALGLLGILQTPETIELAARHYKQAKNMTDKMAALSVLTDSKDTVRSEIFEHFYQEFKEDHLVMDKWFALQALSSRSDTLDRLEALKAHPRFSLKTPNKVRALIGTFTQLNALHFNRADGRGYEFVADTILEIDRFNPQVAARLSGAFRSWRMLEAGRRKLARKQIIRISEGQKLSRDTFEIVSKMLAD